MPNTKEKLNDTIRHLRYCSVDGDCFTCERWNKDCGSWNCVNDLTKTAAELLESVANGVTVQEWIPVTERLPEENTAVLTYRESGINVEFRWHRGWDNDEFTPFPVTHWMPLPEAPKGD